MNDKVVFRVAFRKRRGRGIKLERYDGVPIHARISTLHRAEDILAEEWSSAKAVDEYLRFPSGIFIEWR